MLSIFKNTIDFDSKNSFVLFIFFFSFRFFLLASVISLVRWFIRSFGRSLSLTLALFLICYLSQTLYLLLQLFHFLWICFFFWILKEKVVQGERELLHYTRAHTLAHSLYAAVSVFIYGAEQQQQLEINSI